MESFDCITRNTDYPKIIRAKSDPNMIKSESDYLILENELIDKVGVPGYITINNKLRKFDPDINIVVILNDKIKINNNDIFFISSDKYGIKIYDNFSSSPSFLLTEKCNCKCISCPQPPKLFDEPDWAWILKNSIPLIDNSITELAITGGEPTILWTELIDVIHLLKKYLSHIDIQLLTNARIFKNINKAIEFTNAVDLKKIYISTTLYADIDRIHDNITKINGSFFDTISGLYNLQKFRHYIELRFLITKMNFMRIQDFAEFVYKNLPFVGHVAFMAIEPIGNVTPNFDSLYIDPIHYNQSLVSAIKFLWRREIKTYIFNHQLCRLDKWLWAFAKKAISDWKIKFFPECDYCIMKQDCGGFFYSSIGLPQFTCNPILK